jgi:NADPH-dependent glutamate synthase beta subunit-like oxidoreductase
VRVDGKMQAIPGSEFEIKADLALLAMGFVAPVHEGLIHALGVELDPRGNVAANTVDYKASPRRSSLAAICAVVSRWSSGRSAKAARRRAPSTCS